MEDKMDWMELLSSGVLTNILLAIVCLGGSFVGSEIRKDLQKLDKINYQLARINEHTRRIKN